MKNVRQIIVVDVEATCWENENSHFYGTDRRNEIIEFGITPIDILTGVLGESESIIVKPVDTEISEFCTKLTTLTPEFVEENGVEYEEAIKILYDKYRIKNNVFASWGDYDRRAIEKNCGWRNVPNPLGSNCLNVEMMFTAMTGWKCGVGEALDYLLGIPFEGTPHRGVDDSRMIATIFKKLAGM